MKLEDRVIVEYINNDKRFKPFTCECGRKKKFDKKVGKLILLKCDCGKTGIAEPSLIQAVKDYFNGR